MSSRYRSSFALQRMHAKVDLAYDVKQSDVVWARDAVHAKPERIWDDQR